MKLNMNVDLSALNGIRKKLILIASVLAAACIAQDGKCDDHYKIAPPSGQMRENLSAKFQHFMHADNLPLDANALHAFKIVFVPGLLADPVDLGFGYFQEEMDALKNVGLKEGSDFAKIGPSDHFSGEQSVEANANAIAAFLSQSERPVLLITHSKGSLDSLTALIRHPELRKKVTAWFAIQAPFWGSPIADLITDLPADRGLLSGILQLNHGSMAAVGDLRRLDRHAFMNANAAEIDKIARQIRTISFASSKSFMSMNLSLAFVTGAYCNSSYGCNSSVIDGLVEIDDALLPGTDYVVVDGLDHGDTVLAWSNALDRGQFMRVMTTMLLQ
jgi:hypothetical protein